MNDSIYMKFYKRPNYSDRSIGLSWELGGKGLTTKDYEGIFCGDILCHD